ncbi:LacI family DNA-binding transcriptional regulator [Phycicoccus sonneratiae]|uniref:LacI family DNA-binding transcriptional regulator n=1 Tax=Phycicoccus sonneratiae TaxID=2807628 RepID=A0ABS2CH16_9MICO|nr:LacI family DNA-binding transcriptional regulator [Phycicoccus sonneraticus]MBM6399070.1 LacI family DNA-binding transcriptional regulator [Phycicoccus sonneraticus]
MSGPTRRPTLRDVAGRAGVSTSTASLVFSGKGPVAPATADRVRAAAAELGFSGPDPLATSLRQGRVGTVAVVVEAPLREAFRDPFALAVLDGLADELEAADRTMLLVAQPADDPVRAVAQLSSQAVDAGVFPLCGIRDNPVVEHLAGRGVPLVGSGSPDGPGMAHVRTDEEAAIGLTTQHVLGLGHTRVAHVSMNLGLRSPTRAARPDDLEAALYLDAAGRLRGFRALAGDAAPVAVAADLTVGSGEEAGRLLLDVPADRRPTAVVCQSDLLAAGVVRAAWALGLRVPQDVSVTGFDGVDLPWLDATLTTVLQPGVEKGRALGRLVRRALEGEPVADVGFPVSLRVGTTTAPPPA